jgi:hypothetical protein
MPHPDCKITFQFNQVIGYNLFSIYDVINVIEFIASEREDPRALAMKGCH